MENEDEKLKRARKRVEDIKGWYRHLFIYILMNIILQMFYAGWFDFGTFTQYFPWWVRLTTPFFWGLAVAIHGLWVHKGIIFEGRYKKWEQKSIERIMREEEEEVEQRWK